MYNKSNYEDAFLDWVQNWGGCEYEPELRGWYFYDLIANKLKDDDESACGFAGVDYDRDDYEDDLAVAKVIAYQEA